VKTRSALLLAAFAAFATVPAFSATPQDDWNVYVVKKIAHWGTDPHAILKLQDAAYLGDGDQATLVGAKGNPTSWHWSSDAKAQGPLHVVLSHGKFTVTLNGQPVEGINKSIPVDTDVDVYGEPTPIAAGIDGWRVFVYDQKATSAVKFTGLGFYPYDPAFRVQAKYIPDPKLATTTFHTSHKSDKDYYHTGDAVFTLKGKTFRLPIFARSNDPAQIRGAQGFFTDEMTGKGAYGAGRYIDISFDKTDNKVDADHQITLDFNDAYNPDCARSPFWTCPLTDVHFDLPFTVGERDPHSMQAHEG